MTPSTKNNANTASKARPADDFMSLQELLRLCLANWKWFALSMAACLCAAAAYLLTTPPVYTRSASILVKADSKGQSVTDAAGVLGNIDIFQTNTNVNNELISMQSPAVMLDVVKRLDLDVDYATEGNFYRRVLYGRELPVKVAFLDLQDNETASMVMHPEGGGKWRLSGFTRSLVPEITTRMLFSTNSGHRSKYWFAMAKRLSTSSFGRAQFSQEKQ